MRFIVLLALAGVVGTLARYGLQHFLQPPGGTFPWGTLAVNISGSFLMGFLATYLLRGGEASPELRAVLAVGFCGAFTTMSSFSYEIVALTSNRQYWSAGWYLVTTMAGSCAAIVAGMTVGLRR